MELDWFDCNCGFGTAGKLEGSYFPDASALLDEMDFCGVREGLVHHLAMRAESPQAGNRLVIEGTQDLSRLHPTWALLPPQTEELGTTDEFLAGMRQHSVKALWAYPDECRYALDTITFGSLFEELQARAVPLLLGPDWQAVGVVLKDFPDLTVVVTNHGGWGDDRYFRPLVERYPRLYLDTSNYQLAGGLADFVRKYGPERLLYASGSPALQMGAALMTLAGADMSEEAKAAIAGKNLRRLLAQVKL